MAWMMSSASRTVGRLILGASISEALLNTARTSLPAATRDWRVTGDDFSPRPQLPGLLVIAFSVREFSRVSLVERGVFRDSVSKQTSVPIGSSETWRGLNDHGLLNDGTPIDDYRSSHDRAPIDDYRSSHNRTPVDHDPLLNDRTPINNDGLADSRL
jgi:hypothetical protein